MSGLVLRAIEAELPIPVRERLGEQWLLDAAKQARFGAALREVLLASAAVDCPIIPLKGPVLAATVYAEPALRPSADLDLLVREEDFERCAALLVALGYRCCGEPRLPRRRFAAETFAESVFVSSDGLVPIELHVDPLKVGLRQRDVAGWWSRSRCEMLTGVPARVLSTEHQVLQLAVHLQRHALGLLSWLKDLDLVARYGKPALDWSRLVRLADREDVSRLLWLPLEASSRVFSTPMPPGVLRQLAPSAPARWLLAACLPLRDVVDRPVTPQRRRRVDPINAWLMGRRLERLRALVEHG